MANVTALTMQLEELKDQRSTAQTNYEKAKKSRTWGLIGILIGILLLGLYGLGALFIIAGILAAVTQQSKASKAKSELEYFDIKISKVRQEIIEASKEG